MEDKTRLAKTCGNCSLLRLKKDKFFSIPFCSETKNVVPHNQEGGEFTFWRIPIGCPRKINVKPSEKIAPKRDWVFKKENELTLK